MIAEKEDIYANARESWHFHKKAKSGRRRIPQDLIKSRYVLQKI